MTSVLIGRRKLLTGAGATGLSLAAGSILPADAQIAAAKPDFTLRLAPLSVELAPGRTIRTIGFNGTVPGPTLRVREGQQVSIAVVNATPADDIVHWHSLQVPSEVDGAMEEGSPMIPAGDTLTYSFRAKPAGTRWYHSHATAGKDLTRSLYAGEYGFFIIEAASDPGRYDQEVLLAAHHWEGSWVSMQDLRKGPPPDNGLEVMYGSASFNDRMLGHGDPVRVREGQRVLFRLLNASATERVILALAGHRFEVLALDGNPVPTPRRVDVLQLAPAERVDAIVAMNRPGVWILGGVDEDDRKKGLGIVIEYARAGGPPQWLAPSNSDWDYTVFGREGQAPAPDEHIALKFQKIPGGRGGYNRWTINGKSWPETNPLFTVQEGKRYRLAMTNDSGDFHPVHLHRHNFELVKIADKATAGVNKDTVNVGRFSSVEVDFIANQPGPTLLHCHQQDHQDEGFMGLVTYR